MDNNIIKGLWIGVGVLFFIAVVAIGLSLFRQGQDMGNMASKELSKTSETLLNSKYTMYDGTDVSGTSVVSAIRNFRGDEGDIIIQVTTGSGNTYQYISSGTVSGDSVTSALSAKLSTSSDIANAKDSSHSRYINPSGQFDASIAYDANDVIKAIIFVQN